MKAYSEPCRISKKERVTIADLEAEYIQNLRIFRTVVRQLLRNVSAIF